MIDLTVGICTFNRATLLRQTLDSLCGVAIPAGLRWEVVVIDNNSADDTAAAIDAFAARLPIRRVFEPQVGLSSARNRLLTEAWGRLLLCIDDDVRIEEQTIAALLAAASRWPGGTVFGGPIRPWFQTAPDEDLAAAFPEAARGFCGLDHQRVEGPLSAGCAVFGANMAFATAALGDERFDTRLGFTGTGLVGGEETDFIARIRRRGGEVIWVPAMVVHHYVDPARLTLRYLTRHSAGQGRASVRMHSRPPGAPLLGVPRWLWRRCAETYCAYVFYRLVNARVKAWSRLREHWYWRGVMRECRS